MITTLQTRRITATLTLIVAGFISVAAGIATASDSAPKPVAAVRPALVPGAYFGQKPPVETPELFAPGIINLPGRSVGHIAFSPDATECFFSVFEGFYVNKGMLTTRYENGAWTPRVRVAWTPKQLGFEPLFSRDGRQLYFGVMASTGESANTDFWVAQRTTQGWSEPQPLPSPLNSPQNEFCLAQTADGTMYFASKREGGHGGLDLYRTVAKPGQPLAVENLGIPVNSEFNDGDPGISPDGHTLVFYSVPNRPGVTGGSDLFICFDNGRGGWTTPVNMGPGFNTPSGDEYAATFSHDGQVFFFARFDGKKGEVYWVSTAALERFRASSH